MRCRNTPILTLVLFIAVLVPASAIAQSQSSKSQADVEQGSIKQTRQQLLKIENRLKVLKQQPAHNPVVSQQTKSFLVVNHTIKGVPTYQGRVRTIYFLMQLNLVNQSSQPLKLIRSQIKAKVNGNAHLLAGLPKNLGYKTITIEKRSKRLSSLNFEEEVIVPPGKQGGLWIVITELPAGPDVPEIELQTTVNGQPLILNVNRFELGKLHHTIQLMGPSRCLAKLTIQGELNSINIDYLMQEIDRLTAQNIKRFVMHVPAENSFLEKSVKDWLPRAAEQIGTNTLVEPRFPIFPTMISELHLSGDIFKDVRPRYSYRRVAHATEEAAIQAALDSAMRVLSKGKISELIRLGSPTMKVAALYSGSRQLTNEELDLVLKLTTDQNPRVQEAALYALRYFGDPRAYERLAQVANQPPGPHFEMAVASLAESRFTKAQKLLLQLLKQQPPASQVAIIGIISQSPRPHWNAVIDQFLSSDNQDLQQAAIKALVLNGHPQLFEVLSKALKSSHTELREFAFQELIKRKDADSETLAMNYVLKKLQNAPPTAEILPFIQRTKDPRTIPLLFQHLHKSKLSSSMRISVIKTLSSIGDQTVDEQFLKFFPKANASEKLLILASFQKVKSPHYFKLAAQAMQDSNLSIVNGTISGLRSSASNEAIKILQDTLHKTDQSSTWNAIYSTLVSIGTPEARQTIMDARHRGKIAEKKKAAHTALRNIYQRSPGSTFYKKGELLQQRKEWDKAIGEYQTAINIDELLVPAYLGIANSKNGLKQYEEALKYVEQGLAIDEMHARLYVAKGLIYSNQSQSAEALKQFDKAIEIDPQDSFTYVVLASHYIKLKQNDKALAAYDSAIKVNPRDMNTYEFKAGLQLSLKMVEEALQTYDSAIKANPRHMKSYSNKITLLRKLKRFPQALAVCDDILKVDAKSIYAFLTKAYIYQQLSQIENAIAACDKAIQIKPDYFPSYITKAQIYNESEMWDKAIKVYDQILFKDSRYLNAYTGRGHTNLQKADWKAAQKDFQKAFDLDNKSSQAISGLAICMVYNHKENKAIPFIEGHVKQFEKSGLFRYNTACVYGRALANLRDKTKTAKVIKQITSYQERALQHLTKASEYGFEDAEWMQKDPDLKELQELPDFKSLVQMIQKKRDSLNPRSEPATQNN